MRESERTEGAPGRWGLLAPGGGAPAAAVAWSLPVLVLAAAAGLALFRLPGLEPGASATVVASALAVDLVLVGPGLVGLLLVRTGRLPAVALVPAFVLGYALALATLPERHDAVRNAVEALALAGEGALVVWLALRVRRAFAHAPADGGDFVTRFRTVARQALHGRVPADILTTEVAILHHAFRWSGRQGAPRGDESDDGTRAFTTHREAGYGAVVGAVILLIVIESAALHLLVDLWSGTVAWVLSALAGYGVVWLVGDFRALRARPMVVGRTHLRLRVGIRWEVDVPLDRIEAARPLRPGERRKGDALVAVVLGGPNVRLRLREPVEVTGVYGIRRTAGEILLRVDGAERFCTALESPHQKPADPG